MTALSERFTPKKGDVLIPVVRTPLSAMPDIWSDSTAADGNEVPVREQAAVLTCVGLPKPGENRVLQATSSSQPLVGSGTYSEHSEGGGNGSHEEATAYNAAIVPSIAWVNCGKRGRENVREKLRSHREYEHRIRVRFLVVGTSTTQGGDVLSA